MRVHATVCLAHRPRMGPSYHNEPSLHTLCIPPYAYTPHVQQWASYRLSLAPLHTDYSLAPRSTRPATYSPLYILVMGFTRDPIRTPLRIQITCYHRAQRLLSQGDWWSGTVERRMVASRRLVLLVLASFEMRHLRHGCRVL